MTLPSVSVIIPVINEAHHLPALLRDLQNQQQVYLEIIAGDGGSTDGTLQILRSSGAQTVCTSRGRGVQMNAAAGKSTGKYLFFLHADSKIKSPLLIKSAISALEHQIQLRGNTNVAGHFTLKFIRKSSGNSSGFRYIEAKTFLNRPDTANGDQGVMLTRDYFIRLKGFDERLPFLEDQAMAGKIRKTGIWITFPGIIETSARRFETEGFCRRYILMAMIMGAFRTGMDEFFGNTPNIYPCQHETGKLLLTPYFQRVRQLMLRHWGFKGTARVWFFIGRYVRQNCWQLFFFMDTVLMRKKGENRYPFLVFYYRYVDKLINLKAVDAIIGALSFFCLMGVLAAYFRVSERVAYGTYQIMNNET